MKIWAKGERQGSLCPVCGVENLRWHIFTNHLPVVLCGRNLDKKKCWCGRHFEALEWEYHIAKAGGVLAHYLACALNIGGG